MIRGPRHMVHGERPWRARAAVVSLLIALGACQSAGHSHPHHAPESLPALAREARVDLDAKDATVAFLRGKVERDPDDFIAWNKLAAHYLERLRERGDHDDLARAEAAVRASLRAVPAESNLGGLSGLAFVEQAGHGFEAAAELARRWLELRPGDQAARFLLGDALFEAGRYAEAREVFAALEKDSDGSPETELSLCIRRSKAAWLEGRVGAAREELETALEIARLAPGQGRMSVAWCLWQLGDLALAGGEYALAESHQRAALEERPDYARSLASLAEARAAQGDRAEALELYTRAIRSTPHIVYVAAVGDLYAAAGDGAEAQRWYRWAEHIGLGLDHGHGHGDAALEHHLAQDPGHHARDLALFYADHGLRPDVAYRLARDDYAARKTIESADALSWAALQSGELAAAERASRAALALGTRDPDLLYPAGEVRRAAGDAEGGKRLLEQALALSPAFDVLLAPAARRALAASDAPPAPND